MDGQRRFPRASALLALSITLISACGRLEIGSYGPGEKGAAGRGGSGAGMGGAGGGSPSAGTSGAGFGGDGNGGSGGGTGGGSGTAGSGSGGFESVDIGDTGAVGSTAVDEGTYTVEGSGADIEGTADAFRFVYRALNGDGQIVARIQEVTPTNPWTKVGVMIRDKLTPSAKNGFMLLRPSQGSAFQHRSENGGATASTWREDPWDLPLEHNVRYLRPPKWLKLTREGAVISAYSSDDGACWWRRWTQEIVFDDDEAFFGVALSAGGHGDLAGAVVTNLEAQSEVEPYNARCDRALVDGDIAPPEGWIVPPGRFGGATWDFTITNPNGPLPVSRCDPDAQDLPSGEVAPRKDGPDHPNCPEFEGPEWTRLEFEPGESWSQGPSGIGFRPMHPDDVLSTLADGRGLWLRKVFTLTSNTQKNELMLWGRWGDGITVYVNGVLASRNGGGTSEYRHLGLSDAARRALVVNESNVLAVRLEWDRYYWDGNQVVEGDVGDRFFDLGLTTQGRLSQVPLHRALEPNQAVTGYVDTLKKYVEEQGISGATFAISKGGAIVASAGFGWRDKSLRVPMPRDASLRLAGNDESVTSAAIVKLIEDGVIERSTRVFPLLGLEPVPGRAPGRDVDLITVEDLRAHRSGLGTLPRGQSMLDEMAFSFGISPDQWTSEHAARWLYSLDASNVGGQVRHSSDGYFLLRYLIERLIAPRTLNEYLNEEMGLSGIAVSHERLSGREPNEAYLTREPSWDRWLALENYLALGASATGFAGFLERFALGYELDSGGQYVPAGGGVLISFAPGSWSFALVDRPRALSIVMLSNDHRGLEELVPILDHLTYGEGGEPCMFGAEDPRSRLERVHFISNVERPDLYVNVEHGLAASSATPGWWSAQWRLEPVEGAYYRIQNRWTEQYLHMEGGLLDVGDADPDSWSAQWQLVYVGGVFQLQNRGANRYLSIEDEGLVASSDGVAQSALWRFCN
jgi:hypothetical protein